MLHEQSTEELLEQAKVDFKAFDTSLRIVADADEKSKTSKTALRQRIALLFQIHINKNPEGLKILHSNCALAMSDEPEDQTLLEMLIEAIVDVALEAGLKEKDQKEKGPEKEKTLFLIDTNSIKQLDVIALDRVLKQIEKVLKVRTVIDTEDSSIKLFQK